MRAGLRTGSEGINMIDKEISFPYTKNRVYSLYIQLCKERWNEWNKITV